MRALAVDFGFKDIGLAVGDIDFGIGSHRNPIKASGALKTDALTIASIARNEEVDLVILGLPIEESGEEGRMARICRTLGDHLSQLGLTVGFADESYTSVQAQETLSAAGVPVKRRPELIHGEAAMLILERYSSESQKG